jgi:hypothetical protein
LADIYKVGVELVLMGSLAQGLSGVMGQLLGIESKVGSINKGLGGWGTTLAATAGIAGLGLFAAGMEKVFEQTKKLSDELAKVKQLGASQAELARLHDATVGVTRTVPGMTESSAMRIYRETRGLLGEDEALQALPAFSKFSQVLGKSTGNYENPDEEIKKLMRAADITGNLTNPETKEVDIPRLMRFLDVATKALEATGGMVTPQTWLGMAQQGGISLRGLDQEGLMTMAMMSQVMGGQRAGTAMMSLFQQFAGGTMFTRTAQHLQDIGLLHEGEWKKDGSRVTINDEASKRLSGVFRDDPLKGLTEVILPALKEAGFTSLNDQIRQLAMILQRSTTQRFLGEEIVAAQQMARERTRMAGAQGVDQAQDTVNTTSITAAMHNLTASFEELGQAIGGPSGGIIVSGINSITGAVNGLTEMARAISNSGLGDVFGKIAAGAGQVTGVLAVVSALEWLSHQGEGLDHAAIAIRGAVGALEDAAGGLWTKLKEWVGSHGVPDGGPTGADPWGATGVPGPQKQNFIAPPGNSKPIVTTASLSIDGREIAKTIAENLAEFMEFPNQAPYGDDSSTYHGPAGSTTDT